MQKILTWEVRWFVTGFPPINVQNWFQFNCPGKWLETPDNREDLYLDTPGCEVLSLKQRQGNLELKWCQSEGEIQQFGYNQTIWSGKVEKWIKWTYENLASLEHLSETAKANQSGFSVHKKRLKRLYRGIEYELTQISVNGRHWWTIAFEMEENHQQNREYFEQVINEISRTYQGPFLSADLSYAYPTWQKLQQFASE